MNSPLILGVLALISVGALTATVNAAPIIDYDFEDGLTTGWSAPSGAISVVEDPLNSENKVLKVDYTAEGISGALLTNFTATAGTGIYRLDLDIYIQTPGNVATDQLDRRVALVGAGSATVTYTRFRQSGNSLTFNSYTGSGWTPLVTTSNNKWYHLTQTVDLDSQSWVWTLTDVATNTVVYTQTAGLAFFGGAISSIKQLAFPNIDGTGGIYYLDNVRFEQIPEPQAMSLVAIFAGAGLLPLLCRQRNFR